MEHPLNCDWTLYVTKQRISSQFETETKDWEDRLTKIHKLTTVESFWSVLNNLKSPSDMLNTKGDFYLFRENIQPEWEDPGNTNGGSLCASIDSLKVDEYWLKTLLHIVGNNFEDLSDHLCGAELAVRVKRFRICLWVKNVSLEIVAKIAQKFKILVGQVCLEYKKHGRDAVVCKF